MRHQMKLFSPALISRLAMLASMPLVILALACTTDSPTRPTPSASAPPGTGPTSAAFNVSVTATNTQLVVGDGGSSLVTVRVTRAGGGPPPPDGSTVTVTTTLGELGAPGTGTRSVLLSLLGGFASVELFSGTSTGTANIQARIEDSVGSLNIAIVDQAVFFLDSIQPNTGSPAGGETAVISGGGFRAPVRVEFQLIGGGDTVTAQVVSVTETSVNIVVPPSPVAVPVGETRAFNVQVTIDAGTVDEASNLLASAFRYALGGSILQPAVSSISPASGPNEGGVTVQILGDGFEQPVQVMFGNGSTASFEGVEAVVQSVTRTRIVATTPAATGFGQALQNSTVDLLVRNRDSGFATVVPSAFQFGNSGPSPVQITSIAPGEGSHLGGTTVTLFGQGFDEPVAVDLAGVTASPLSVSGTEVVVRSGGLVVTSCGDVAGPSQIVNVETGEGATGPSFIYRTPIPVITGISPNSAGEGGGPVTISGFNFEEPVEVIFNGVPGTGTVATSGGSISVTAPPFSGDFDEEMCMVGSSSGSRFVPTLVDVEVTNLLTTCSDDLQMSFTYIPSDQSCRIDPPPPPPAPVAAFSFFTTGGAGSLTAQFVDESTNATGYSWSFGDGGSSTGANPVHTYAVPGTYSVSLTVSNASGSDTVIKPVTVPTP